MLIESNRTEVVAVILAAAIGVAVLAGCGDNSKLDDDDTPVETTLFETDNNYAPFDYQPTFEPDYMNLTAQPWVEPATEAQSDAADVWPDRLEFPETMADIASWKPGRIVVGGPNANGEGMNALGAVRAGPDVRTAS